MRVQMSINLSAIPEDAIKWVGSTAFVNLFVSSMHTPDKFGNHLYVAIDGYLSKAGKKVFVGTGKAQKRYTDQKVTNILVKSKRQLNPHVVDIPNPKRDKKRQEEEEE